MVVRGTGQLPIELPYANSLPYIKPLSCQLACNHCKHSDLNRGVDRSGGAEDCEREIFALPCHDHTPIL